MHKRVLLAAFLVGLATAAFLRAAEGQGPARPLITIDATAQTREIGPQMYGIFFEEISHAGDGGLYAELVQNRDMEASTIPDGWTVDPNGNVVTPKGWRTRRWFKTDLPGWSLVKEGDAEGSIQLDADAPLNDRNPHSLRLSVTKLGTRCGVANSGYWGINVQEGQWYDASFYARTAENKSVGLVFSLESQDSRRVCARATIPEIGRGGRGPGAEAGASQGSWRRYTLSLRANASDPNCRLVISAIEPVTVWLDVVSLFPRKTFKDRPNGMRQDLGQLLADLRPGFLRFPGGCVVEGCTLYNRFRWKDSIGDISQRKGDFNLWGYYSTYGLGFHEYLQLAEDLGAEAMYVVNVGMSCQARRPNEVAADPNVQDYLQETLDALEYATGPATSQWGAKRVANGRPEPFKIKYVEIGNESNGPDYRKHYRVFYDAIKAKYPQVTTIADERMPDLPMEFVDDHFYVNPARFFNMAGHYDDASRSGPKIYVGEYAVNRGVGTGNLLGGLAEAVFMLAMERNADVVRMCSYAPLFENVNQRNWPVNLILLDSSRSVGRSSYQIQRLFGEHRPDVVLQTQVQASPVELTGMPASMGRGRGGQQSAAADQWAKVQQIYALAGLAQKQGEVILKVVNPTPSPVSATVSLKGFSNLGSKAKVLTLAHADAAADNSLDKPNVVVPKESEMAIPGATFPVDLAANSLTILRIPTK
jgi:alpha-L-arabinofuranosidase